MTQSSKGEIYKKWAPILENIGVTGSKSDWLSEWAEIHSKNEIDNSKSEEFPSILPIAMKVAAKTISQDIVSVKPLDSPMGISSEEMKRIEADIKAENREGKIESILEGKEYKEKTLKDHPDYKEGGLFYLDFKYESHKKTRRSGKKHKNKNNEK
jgi:hypothetical protein